MQALFFCSTLVCNFVLLLAKKKKSRIPAFVLKKKKVEVWLFEGFFRGNQNVVAGEEKKENEVFFFVRFLIYPGCPVNE